MSSADQFIVNESMASQSHEYIFEKKEMLYTIDANNGSYSNGTILFDFASISNSGKVIDWRNSTLVIPYVVQLSGAALDANVANVFAVSLKNHIHTIDSMSVQLSNHNVVEPSAEYSNIPCSFKLLTEFSEQELKQMGYSIGFHKDNAYSLRVATANSASGVDTYELNNGSTDVLTVPVSTNTPYGNPATISAFSNNPAIMQRQLDTSYDLTNAGAGAQNIIDSGKRHCIREAGAVKWFGLITLELRFLNDFFDKMPLVRNSYMKMNIVTNLQCRSTLTVNGAGAFTALTTALSAKTCPYNIGRIGSGLTVVGAGGELVVESGIGRLVSNPAVTNPIFTACRVYTPAYTFAPQFEETYFSQAPKVINYSAYLRAVTPTIPVNGSLNSFLVSNAISRVKSILVFPVMAAQNNMLSPFSSCPTTCMPYAFVSNFNVRVGGSPHYAENQVYSWEHYKEEISQRGINGNLEVGIGSSLLNELEWNSAYRFLYIDLSRKASQAQADVAKSIILEGKNSSSAPVVYHVFVEYEKTVTINQSTGQLVLA